MHIIKYSLMAACLLCSSYGFAEEDLHANHHNDHQNTSNVMTMNAHNNANVVNLHKHGDEIYQFLELEQKGLWDKSTQATSVSALKYWLGNDEHKLWIKAHIEKSESMPSEMDWSVSYRRYLAEFWDVYAGVQQQRQDKDKYSGIFGLHGLAPYFFETDAYLYANAKQVGINLETSRDILLTQKLITQPFIEADIVLKDDSQSVRKSGLSVLNTGVQTRYEINKQVMPFVELSYQYQREDASMWRYGAGIQLKF